MQDEDGHVSSENNDLARHCLCLLHEVLHTNTDTDIDMAVVAEAIRLMIDIIQLPTMAGMTIFAGNSDLVDRALGCLFYLTQSTEGHQQALQLLGVASIEDLMRAALTWLEADSVSEAQCTDAAREALPPPSHGGAFAPGLSATDNHIQLAATGSFQLVACSA